ncbi:hypothetical protein CC80DRAFT_582363 [Byssothecium circinans]|uniref:Uncharacterized protein n=1 Tax=Byssothecium circinans TaxID=147558 RepID=A0A6A5U5S3_9PLEO|nr:hypothetical protein CC80DRAFT_582363 [Byssothecium circinans]
MHPFHSLRTYWQRLSADWIPFDVGNDPHLLPIHQDEHPFEPSEYDPLLYFDRHGPPRGHGGKENEAESVFAAGDQGSSQSLANEALSERDVGNDVRCLASGLSTQAVRGPGKRNSGFPQGGISEDLVREAVGIPTSITKTSSVIANESEISHCSHSSSPLFPQIMSPDIHPSVTTDDSFPQNITSNTSPTVTIPNTRPTTPQPSTKRTHSPTTKPQHVQHQSQ